MSYPTQRFRRLRSKDSLRRLVRETRLTPDALIAPLFVCRGSGVKRPIAGMPGHYVSSVDAAVEQARGLAALGVGGVLLFGVPDAAEKDPRGECAADPDGPVPLALRAIAELTPSLTRWADVCLCAYTTHGHCGVLDEASPEVRVDNDRSLAPLAAAARAYAAAGADVVAPSDMMDGRVGAIRSVLDAAGSVDTVICSYAAKYASAFYGPFRDAANSTPAAGDRRGYQMDPANADEAVREVGMDIEEGADIVMVKPALIYLDVLYRVKERFRVPTAAYHVSGEYAMVHAAHERGWLDRDAAMLEALVAIRRAGADIIVTYAAGDVAERL